jgi:hypothetical protein
MTKTRLVSILSTLAVLVLGSLPAQASDRTPEQVAELYYRAWLNYDRAAAVQLNTALRPETGGRDLVDLGMIADPVAWQLRRIASLSARGDPSAPEIRRLMAKFIIAGSKRVRCRAVGSEIGARPAGERFRATVKLECAVPDAVAGLRQTKEHEQGRSNMVNPSPRLLKGVIEAFERAPLTRRVSTEMDVTAGSAKQRWMPDTSRSGMDQVTGAIARQIGEAGLGP